MTDREICGAKRLGGQPCRCQRVTNGIRCTHHTGPTPPKAKEPATT